MAEETETGAAAPTGVEKMVADAVADLKGFCDGIRSDFDALKGRMDSMEAPRADAVDEPDVAGVAVETPTPGVTETGPASDLEVAPSGGDRIGAVEDAAMTAAAPVELAADAGEPLDLASMADSAAKAVAAPLRADIDRLSRLIPAELTIEQRQQFAAAQEQAEIAFQSFGDHAPAPMQGEGIGTYKRRLAAKMQPHSEKWKSTKLTAISDDSTLDVIVSDIYNDAVGVARRGSDVAPGMLVPVTRRTEAGHTIREYRGSPGAWMKPLAGATRRATGKFNSGR